MNQLLTKGEQSLRTNVSYQIQAQVSQAGLFDPVEPDVHTC